MNEIQPTVQEIVSGNVREIMMCVRGEHVATIGRLSFTRKVEHPSTVLGDLKEIVISVRCYIVTGPLIPVYFSTDNDLDAVAEFYKNCNFLKNKELADAVSKTPDEELKELQEEINMIAHHIFEK